MCHHAQEVLWYFNGGNAIEFVLYRHLPQGEVAHERAAWIVWDWIS